MKLILSKLLPLFTAGVILLCSVFALVPIESFAESAFKLPLVSAYTYSAIKSEGVYVYTVSGGTVYYSGAISASKDVYLGIVPSGSGYHAIFVSSGDGSSAYLAYGSSYVGVRQTNSVDNSYNLYYGTATGVTSYNPDIPLFNSLSDCLLFYAGVYNPTPTPTVTPTPTPVPTATPIPSVDDYFRPFRSFSATYYNSEVIVPPDSLTLDKYEQYTGLASNHPIRVTDARSNIDFMDDKVVYKFEYDFRAGATDSFDISVLYDADTSFGYAYAYISVGSETYDGYALSQSPLNGTYRIFGNADVPEALQGYTNWSWEHNLVNQRAISLSGVNLSVDDRVTLIVIVASSTLPHLPSEFDWSQFFQDTRPDNIFLTVTGGLAALPFFVSGLSFLALGALIGIILKFMR